MSPDSIIVTGARGYIGRSVVAWFRERGLPVLTHARHRNSAAPDPVDVWGDLADPAVGARVCAAAKMVVHCAARVGAPATSTGDRFHQDLQRDNVLATRHLSGAQRLVHLSTVAVYGHRAQRLADESTATAPEDAYAHSKLASEHEAGARAVVLRLGLVWGGPFDDRLVGAFERALRTRLLWLPGPCDAPLPLLHVHNLCGLLERLHQLDDATWPTLSGVYNLTDGRPESARSFIERLARVRHLPGPRGSLPLAPIRWGVTQLSALFAARVPALRGLRPEILELLNTPCSFDIGRARTQLGYTPAHRSFEHPPTP